MSRSDFPAGQRGAMNEVTTAGSPNQLFGRPAHRLFGVALVAGIGVACSTAGTMASAGSKTAAMQPGARGGLLPAATHAPSATQKASIRDSVQAVLLRAVADSAFPGAYAVVGTSHGIIAEFGAGKLDADDATRPNNRTVWDMASMSKLMSTTSAMIQLVGSKRVSIDSPVVYYLPSWKAAGTERITVKHLLTHSSGLPAGRPLYKEADTDTAARTLVYATGPVTTPGTKYVYSDLGFILLGRLVQQVTGQPLDQYVEQHVFGPLKMTDTRYLPPASWLPRIAPTEIDPWRGRHIRGEVHDENASRLGGVAGHAGLFSSARDVARFAQMYLQGGSIDGTRIFDTATLNQFITIQDKALSHRALGWETANGTNSAGHRLAPVAFGHTGFTGTSMWMDPTRDLYVVLLSNRVNPTRTNLKISGVRTALADAVVAALEGPAPARPSR
ncbi:MAG: serine hydrolase domain-containing protein [Gemmatimonadaceae bacterium]